MRIVVCMKQVPDTSGKIAVYENGTLNRASMQAIANPDDMCEVGANEASRSPRERKNSVTPLYWCKLNRATGSSFRYNVKRQSNIIPRRKNHGSTQYYIESGRNTTTT